MNVRDEELPRTYCQKYSNYLCKVVTPMSFCIKCAISNMFFQHLTELITVFPLLSPCLLLHLKSNVTYTSIAVKNQIPVSDNEIPSVFASALPLLSPDPVYIPEMDTNVLSNHKMREALVQGAENTNLKDIQAINLLKSETAFIILQPILNFSPMGVCLSI